MVYYATDEFMFSLRLWYGNMDYLASCRLNSLWLNVAKGETADWLQTDETSKIMSWNAF